MAVATVTTNVKIDVGPDGISFTFEGLDKDLSDLIQKANKYEVILNEYRTFDSNDVILRSVQQVGFVDRPVPPVVGEDPPATGGEEVTEP